MPDARSRPCAPVRRVMVRATAFAVAASLVLGACAAGGSEGFTIVAKVDYEAASCEDVGRQFGRHLDAAALHAEATGEIDVTYSGDVPDFSPEVRQLYLFDHLQGAHTFTLRLAVEQHDLACSGEELHRAAMPHVSDRACDVLAERVRGRGDGEHGTVWDCDAWRADMLRVLRILIPAASDEG